MYGLGIRWTSQRNVAKYLLVRQDLFDRTVDAKILKTKDSKETIRAFLTTITEKIRPKKIWVDKGTEFAGGFKKLCKAEEIQIYSTTSEIKPAFAKRTKRSLKINFKITCKIMDTKSFTNCLNSSEPWIPEKKSSIDFIRNHIKNSDFLSSLYSQPLREYRKPNFKIGHRVRISEWAILQEGLQATIKTGTIWNCGKFFQKNSNIHNKGWTGQDYPWYILSETVHQHLRMESFIIELVSTASAQLFPDHRLSSFTNLLAEQLNLEGQWEVAISEKSNTSMYKNVREKIHVFGQKHSKSPEMNYLEPGIHPSITDFVEAMNNLFDERHNHGEKLYHT